MSVRVQGQYPGLLHKYVWVEGPAGAAPLATIELQMTIREAAAPSAAALSFGAVPSGVAHSLALTVTVDADVVPHGGLPALAGARPDVQVRPAGPPRPTQRDGRPSVRQDYQVTLAAAAPVGRLADSLRFRAAPGSALSAVSVPVSGEVTDRLSASPRALFFGSVPAGRDVRRQVLLSVTQPGGAGPLTVTSDSPWLRVAWADAVPGGVTRLLRVTLDGHAPPGLLDARLAVTAGGERLVVPVTAEITAPARHSTGPARQTEHTVRSGRPGAEAARASAAGGMSPSA